MTTHDNTDDFTKLKIHMLNKTQPKVISSIHKILHINSSLSKRYNLQVSTSCLCLRFPGQSFLLDLFSLWWACPSQLVWPIKSYLLC